MQDLLVAVADFIRALLETKQPLKHKTSGPSEQAD